MSKKVQKYKNYLMLLMIIIILFVVLIFLVISTVNASKEGTAIGNTIGYLVGKSTGSAKALSEASVIIEDGEDEGVTAEDTEVVSAEERVRTKGKLRVLDADVSLDNLNIVGEDEKYKALYIMEGTVNFTVDLADVEIKHDKANRTLLVIIPEPTAELKIKYETVQKLSESKKFSLINEADRGSEQYINTMEKLQSEVEKHLGNYDSLMKIAKDESKIRVKDLIGSLSFVDHVDVQFKAGDQWWQI